MSFELPEVRIGPVTAEPIAFRELEDGVNRVIRALNDEPEIDLSGYYTKAEVDALLVGLDVDIDLSDYYTKSETDALLDNKANLADIPTDFYTKAQADARFAPTVHTHDDRYYTELEADGRFAAIVHAHVNRAELPAAIAYEDEVNIFTNDIRIRRAAAASEFYIEGDAGFNRLLRFNTFGGGNRWAIYADSSAESGGDAGSALRIVRYLDDGTLVPWSVIRRSDGVETSDHSWSGTHTFTGQIIGSRSATAETLSARTTGDAASRWQVRGDGRLVWGDGLVAGDVELYRVGVGILRLGTGGADRLGINVDADSANTILHLAGRSPDSTQRFVVQYHSSNTGAPVMEGRKARGTIIATPAVVLNNDNTLIVRGQGHDGTTWVNTSQIVFAVAGTPATGVLPGRIEFHTSDAAGVMTERLRISADGLSRFFYTAQFDMLATFVSGLTVTGGVQANGTIWKGATHGLTIQGVPGSSNDFAVFSAVPARVISIPTGTSNLVFNGGGGTALFTGAVTLPAPLTMGGVVFSNPAGSLLSLNGGLTVTGAFSATDLVLSGGRLYLDNAAGAGSPFAQAKVLGDLDYRVSIYPGEIRIGDGTAAPVKVLGARSTGWTAWTGASSKVSRDTATVTPAQHAQATKAIIDLLIAHGLAGA